MQNKTNEKDTLKGVIGTVKLKENTQQKIVTKRTNKFNILEKSQRSPIIKVECSLTNIYFLLANGEVFEKNCSPSTDEQTTLEHEKNQKNKTLKFIQIIPDSNPDVKFRNITAGDGHVLLLDSNNQVWGWGSNKQKQIDIDSDDFEIKTVRYLEFINNSFSILDVYAIKNSSMLIANSSNVNKQIYMWGSVENSFIAKAFKSKAQGKNSALTEREDVKQTIHNSFTKNMKSCWNDYRLSKKDFDFNFIFKHSQNRKWWTSCAENKNKINGMIIDFKKKFDEIVIYDNRMTKTSKMRILTDELDKIHKKIEQCYEQRDYWKEVLELLDAEIIQINNDLTSYVNDINTVDNEIEGISDQLNKLNYNLISIWGKSSKSKGGKGEGKSKKETQITNKNKEIKNWEKKKELLNTSLKMQYDSWEQKAKQSLKINKEISEIIFNENHLFLKFNTLKDMSKLLQAFDKDENKEWTKEKTVLNSIWDDEMKEKYNLLFSIRN